MKRALFVTVLIGVRILAQGQGFLRGKIIDGETGEGLIAATVAKKGTSIGTAADFDGNYSLALDAGVHNIVFQFVSYQTQTITSVEIKDGQVTSLDVTMIPATTELREVVVTAAVARDNEVGLLTVQKKSPNMLDGISSQTFRKLGDNDLGAAMKRVTGVSVQGGKYVYVRGLGDRYTLTNLNGMTIPGLDPDNNSVQIDIFPTSTIENVIVYKTFSPNLPGDFTGGLVDVESKNFPDEKTTSFSLGTGYNPAMNLQKGFLTYNGGKTDFLAFDDGTRALLFDKRAEIPDITSSNRAENEMFTRSFNPQMAAQVNPSFLNYNLFFNHGNQFTKRGATYGYNAMLSYKTDYEYYDKVEFGEYIKDADANKYELQGEEVRKGQLGTTNVGWSGLLAGAIKYGRSDFAMSILRNQDASSTASRRRSVNLLENPAILDDNILTYTQREVTNAILVGRHHLDNLDLEWRGAFSKSRIYEPDFRVTRLQYISEGVYNLQVGVGAGIDRFYRDLNEDNGSFKVDGTYKLGERNKLKAGIAGIAKARDFEVLAYYFRVRGAMEITGDPDDFLKPENIWTPSTNIGTYVKGNYEPANTYSGRQEVYAAYLMSEMQLTSDLKAIYGARVEKTRMHYTGTDQNNNVLNDALTLNDLDILPSANLVYSLTDAMNIRLSANRTLARPSFREKSNAQLYNANSKRTEIGNLGLQEVHVDNFDLRWENFFGRGEMVSFSAFYKAFDGHIEMVSYETNPDNLKPRNAGKSEVYGLEMEFRKSLSDRISVGSNASLERSAVRLGSIEVNDMGKTELSSRQENARTGEVIKYTRPMARQSPYLINAFVGYQDESRGLAVNLAYNVQGETLSIVGSGRVPDIYTIPYNSLNLSASKAFGTREKSKLSLSISNLLSADKTDVYKSYEATDEIFSNFMPGMTFSLKYTHTF